MMLIVGLLVLVAVIAGLAMSAVIAYHFLKFGVQGDRSRVIVAAFTAGSVLWIVLFLGSYFAVPWETIFQFELPSLPRAFTPATTP